MDDIGPSPLRKLLRIFMEADAMEAAWAKWFRMMLSNKREVLMTDETRARRDPAQPDLPLDFGDDRIELGPATADAPIWMTGECVGGPCCGRTFPAAIEEMEEVPIYSPLHDKAFPYRQKVVRTPHGFETLAMRMDPSVMGGFRVLYVPVGAESGGCMGR